MKSKTTRDFWKLFQQLPKTIQLRAIMTYRRWQTNSYHPSLHFKPVGINLPIYSVRIGYAWRALGLWKGDTITWFWIGSHEEYNQVIKSWRH